jgi:TRAP-type C4-dicarboxylate transport system permease small subunit
VGFTFLIAICVITMYDGLARYSHLPRIPGFRDFGEVIFAVLIACCFPIGLLKNRNITITFLGALAGPRVERAFNLFGAVLVLAGFAIIAWALIQRTGGLGERTTRTGYMMLAPWAWTATAIMCSAILVQLWVVVARLAELVTGRKLVEDLGGNTEHVDLAPAADGPDRR